MTIKVGNVHTYRMLSPKFITLHLIIFNANHSNSSAFVAFSLNFLALEKMGTEAPLYILSGSNGFLFILFTK